MTDAENQAFMEALAKARQIAQKLAQDSSKRSAPDDGENGQPVKRFGGFASSGPPGIAGANGSFNPGQQTQENWTVPNRMVGLIIGKGGENITRIQETCGAKLQLGQEAVGEERPCVIYGSPAAIQKCKEMVNEIIEGEGKRGPGGPGPGGMHTLGVVTVEVHIPKHKVGQIIGKGGETIRALQDKTRVRMFLIQDVDPSSPTKPIKITGDPERVENARKLIEEMISTPDGPGGMGGPGIGQVQDQLRVPKGCVGVIIGKGGETIRDIQTDTGARVQFVDAQDPTGESDKTCLISGRPAQVQEARRMIDDLLANSVQMKQQSKPRYECEELYKVPASKTGIIIGKGGETIRMICERSGAKVELDRSQPQTGEDRLFHMRGNRDCVEAAKRMIEEKLSDPGRGGSFGDSRQGGAPWEQPGAASGFNWMDPNAAAQGDPSAAFWGAYCQQYYSMVGGMGPPQQPGMSPYMQPQGHPAPPPPESSAPTMDPNSSYYYQAAVNPQPTDPALAAGVQTSADGTPDFSLAWIQYYRTVGMHKEADDLEASLKSKAESNDK